MNNQLEDKLNRYERKQKARKRWLSVVGTLSAVVAVGTTIAFIKPAAAQEQPTYCGYEEHLEHTDACYDRLLVCPYQDGAQSGIEAGAASRSEAAGMVVSESGAASGTDSAVPSGGVSEAPANSSLEVTGHVHSDSCYAEERVVSCGLEEAGHTHTDACWGSEVYVTCGLEETAGHTHTDDCYLTEEYYTCGLEETDGHSHGSGCWQTETELVCENTEEGHEHTDECYQSIDVLVCGMEEIPAHHHDDSCRVVNRTLICGMEEAPAHTHENCFATRPVLVCGMEETASAHTHDESCYTINKVLVCGMEETVQNADGGAEQADAPVSEPSAEAVSESVSDSAPVEGTEAGAKPHEHTEECYQVDYNNLICGLPIHEHTLQCFSDPDADKETAESWERTFERVELTGNWNEDVIAIAKTQLGYTESERNYEVLEDGTSMNGYSRYGDWYGYPYSDWCAMFCSFCMNYAEVDPDLMPKHHVCQTWIDQLSDPELDLYRPADDYVPVPGDLVFFDLESFDPEHPELRDADHVGFVSELIYDDSGSELVKIRTIEGNYINNVAENTYDWNDSRFLGYGILPQNPEYVPPVDETLLNTELMADPSAEPSAAPEGEETDGKALPEGETSEEGKTDAPEKAAGASDETEKKNGAPEGTEKTSEASVKREQTLESAPASDGAVAVISGLLPENARAEIRAVSLSAEELIAYFGPEKAGLMTGYVAYDIRIMVGDTEWQPDSTVSVTVRQPELPLDSRDYVGLAHVEEATHTVTDVEVQNKETNEVAFSVTEEISSASAGEFSVVPAFSAAADPEEAFVNPAEAYPVPETPEEELTFTTPELPEISPAEISIPASAANADAMDASVTDVSVSTNGTDEITFEADSFSVYILYTSFTVDFRYDGIEYSMNGMQAMRLSALFVELGIWGNASEVSSAFFSDPALLRVEPTGDGDWLLSSLAPFSTDETLTVLFEDGTQLIIDTTDANYSVSAKIAAEWDPVEKKLSSVFLKAKSTAQAYLSFDSFDGSVWTPGAGSWTSSKIAVNTETDLDITDHVLNECTLNTKYRARVAENTANPTNDRSGCSREEFSLYDILEAAKPGFTEWVSGAYLEFFGGSRPTTSQQLLAAFEQYYALPSLTLESGFTNDELLIVSTVDPAPSGEAVYVWQYNNAGSWVTLAGEEESTLNATRYSKLTPGAEPLLDGGKSVRCLLKEGDEVRAAAVIDNINPLKEVYDTAINDINAGLHLSSYEWYLNGALKTANVEIGSTAFKDYFYYDNVARDPDVPFYDGESYANYLASEYLRVKEASGEPDALSHVAAIWDQYIFDIYNPNPDAGVVGNYSYYPGANKNVDPNRYSTYGDKIIEWPKDGASSFHNPTSGVDRNGVNGLVRPLAYDFLEGGVDYSRFIQDVSKTATADAAGDNNTNRSYDIDITAKTQATSVSPLAMLLTVQTSWQMFDYPHANCVSGDGTYTSIEVGGAQHNTEMASLYDIKQAILRFISYMEENYPGHNLVLGINEVQHGGSYNLINYSFSGGKNNSTVYVSNNPGILRDSVYNWDSFGNCEHVHYDTGGMTAAAAALEANLTGWVDINEDPIQYSDINKVAVIIGGGTENSNGTNGYGCALPWGTFYSNNIDAVYGIRTNVGSSLNADGVLSWLDYYKNNTGNPYHLSDPSYSGASQGNFTGKYVAPSEDAVYNALVKIAQKELKTKGVKVQDESRHIDEVTLRDTVNDEFMLEKSTAEAPKPFIASVFDKNGNKSFETEITPTAYDESGNITAVTAAFRTYLSDGTVSSETAPVPEVKTENGVTAVRVPVDVPYSYLDSETGGTVSGTQPYTQTLSISEKTDGTTDVSYDFGPVYNSNDANLHFEVIAREDYIGSNNVFTNESVPSVSFSHQKLNRNGEIYIDPATGAPVVVSDTVEGYDTPEVNVPVRFTVNNGGSITVEVKTPVNLEDLSTTPGGMNPTLPKGYSGTETDIADSEYITETVHDLIDNYDQISGTVSYTWVIPGGKEYPVPVTLHVTNGVPDKTVTVASDMAQQWKPKTGGEYDVVLRVTFTPDPVADNGNFADDGGVTATRVTKLDQEGHEKIIVENSSGGTSDTELTVTKVWSGEKGNTGNRPSGITFNVFQDGEFYDQKTVSADNGWSWTFSDMPYKEGEHIFSYTVTEDNVPGYEASVSEMQMIFPPEYYWVEVPMEDVDLTGETEYMIVEKTTAQGISADGSKSLIEVEMCTEERDEPPAVADDASSWFADNGYSGFFLFYSGPSEKEGKKQQESDEQSRNYIKTADGKFLKKDGSVAADASADTWLRNESFPNGVPNGIIRLNDKAFRIKLDNNNYSLANDGTASAFTFYEKTANPAYPTYRTSVTNTYIPGGVRPNETSVTVTKEWVRTGDGSGETEEETDYPEITIDLLQNGKVLDTCTLDETANWTHTFSTLPGTETKLPYFDPLTGETYDYTVQEKAVSGYETGYLKALVKDPSGGMHFVLFNESSDPGSEELWDSTAYVLVTPLTVGKGDKAVTKDYVIGSSGSGFTYTGASVREADDPATAETEYFSFGNLTCTKELVSSVPGSAIWTLEPYTDPKGHSTFLLKVNGQYLGLKKDNKNLEFVSAAKEKEPNCNWQYAYDSGTGTVKLYALAGDKYDQTKYLTLTVNDKGALVAGADGDASKAAKFTVFEQVSLQSKYDTYSYTVQNIPTDEPSSDGKVEYSKYIDCLMDNTEGAETENPDTSLEGDYYRLYLEAVGTRYEDSEAYPEFRGVYITDHLSRYVTLAENGSKVALTVNKVSMTDPDDITYLWSGNLNTATGEIGRSQGDGASVIQSVVYTGAGEEETDTSGKLRVDFQPDYCLEEGYKYVVSYNVEASELAKKSSYPKGIEGDPETDYPGNDTSSGKPGFRSNSGANVVYTQNGEVKIGVYDHPVIQVETKMEMKLRKVDASPSAYFMRLSGAEFDLYLETSGAESASERIPGVSGKYGIKMNSDKLVSSSAGDIPVKDLVPGRYYLIETGAPHGYLRLSGPVEFELENGKIEMDSDPNAYPDKDDPLLLIVTNTSGYELPRTGGSGVLLVYTLGVLLFAGALVRGLFRRRKES